MRVSPYRVTLFKRCFARFLGLSSIRLGLADARNALIFPNCIDGGANANLEVGFRRRMAQLAHIRRIYPQNPLGLAGIVPAMMQLLPRKCSIYLNER
jgi:hypothetical protein